MKTTLLVMSAVAAMSLGGAGAANAGCLGGAVVGGVGGHFAGHHPILGAAAGCAVGHHMSVMKKRRLMAQRAAMAHGQPVVVHH